jgi:hypothetical protein
MESRESEDRDALAELPIATGSKTVEATHAQSYKELDFGGIDFFSESMSSDVLLSLDTIGQLNSKPGASGPRNSRLSSMLGRAVCSIRCVHIIEYRITRIFSRTGIHTDLGEDLQSRYPTAEGLPSTTGPASPLQPPTSTSSGSVFSKLGLVSSPDRNSQNAQNNRSDFFGDLGKKIKIGSPFAFFNTGASTASASSQVASPSLSVEDNDQNALQISSGRKPRY